jgi:glycosyltransferase involved in cell wall biosynthesis
MFQAYCPQRVWSTEKQMPDRVALIWFGDKMAAPPWSLGEVVTTKASPRSIYDLLSQRVHTSDVDSYLFWDSSLGCPNTELIRRLLTQSANVYHAGLLLGMNGLPGSIDFISPTWMLNCDSDPQIESTSWRLSLRACLIKAEVLRQMGSVLPQFTTLEAASLEMGHRFATQGVLVRHHPNLVSHGVCLQPESIPIEDELRFAYHRFGRFWSRWAALRALTTGYASPLELVQAWRKLAKEDSQMPAGKNYRHAKPAIPANLGHERVTVLIPTLDRYSYLRKVLDQLRSQSISAHEIIVIDQTAAEERDRTLAQDFADLPLRIIYRDEPGQCASRNEGLQIAQGDYILFIDDDDEIPSDLISSHLENLHRFQADVSCGVANEVGAGSLPTMFTYTRASDVFPTNNSLIRKSVLEKSGLFDLAYDRGQRADGDLGMRIYLIGALMILNPEISVLHHHAPTGGLRSHRARVVTYAGSRRSLTQRQLPSATEIYLTRRYFSPRQLREELWLRTFGTFSVRGGIHRKILKYLISLVCLPDTLWQTWRRSQQTRQMFESFPQIPNINRNAPQTNRAI